MAFEDTESKFEKVLNLKAQDTEMNANHAVAQKTPRGHGSYTLRQDLLQTIAEKAQKENISKSTLVEQTLVKALMH